MTRFRLSRDTVRAGSLTSRERRELRHLEHRAERERESVRRDQELVEKAREMRKEREHGGLKEASRHGGRGRLLLALLIIAAIAYAYLKYFRK
jgi:ferric-dicitrate binding protein FerR (iron transport regulator)